MPRIAAVLAVAMLTVFAAGGVRQGCRDVRRSATTLRYPPIRDMRQSVAILPQTDMLLAPDSASVPVTGIDRDRGRDVLAATLVNPTPPADLAAAAARGQVKFGKTCVPCHGSLMKGDGPVVPFFMPPPDLLAQATRQRKDGYIYSYIRHGGVVMPSYGAQVTSAEAWDVINYLRAQQKANPR